MITLSNGHSFEYMVASGALAYDGRGWMWERPLVWARLINPALFTIVIKTLTRYPRRGNLRRWKPWECVRCMKGGSVVNKVGLTNPGIDWWMKKVGLCVDRDRIPLVGSIFGARSELVYMAKRFNNVDVVALEVNASCPNTGHPMNDVLEVVEDVRAVKHVSGHPIIIKLSVAQDYCEIAQRLEGVAEAVSLNSVPWEIVFPPDTKFRRSPLASLQRRVGGGGGGVSGRLAQKHNWLAVNKLRTQVHAMPIIGPSVMSYEDIDKVRGLGASAVSFGAIHLRTPWRPTSFVRRHEAEKLRVPDLVY